ncbi:MAG TPA: transketolase family protein [Candidatus Aminicenantes bacterium]|nr:transketolase family protein [Candidatus Aminicenantes bacterium]
MADRPQESLRNTYGKTLLALGRKNPDIIVLDADLAKSTQTQYFGKEIGDRFIDIGLSEQDMVSTAAGISLTGKTVFASSFCVFLAGRVFDQVRQSVCYNRANVKLVATHSGLGVGEDGATHQALEDIALMRTLPGMRVIVPADSVETASVIEFVAKTEGPFYVRLTRSNQGVIHPADYRFRFGQIDVLRTGSDVTLAACGTMVEKMLDAADLLAASGISAAVLNVSTVKPLDGETLLRFARATRGLVTMEDHTRAGGLGSALAEYLCQHHPVPMRILGVDDQFGCSGKPEELYRHFGLTAEAAATAARELANPR